MGVKVIDGKKYELVPPDGGWGYIIAIGVSINLITICVFLTCFGMIYKNLFIELAMDSTSVTLLNGVNALCVALSGLATTPLLKVMSIRQLGLIAAVLHNMGTIFMIFVNSKLTFFIFFGIFQSIGHGLIFNLSCTILNNYFVKRRILAVSITQTAVGLASLFSPQFVKWALETYAFKGTILLISAVSLHNIVTMLLMHPVQWHMKKEEVQNSVENETKTLLSPEEQPTDKDGISNEISDSGKISDTRNKSHNINKSEEQLQCIKKIINTFLDLSIIRSFLLSNASIGTALSITAEYTFVALLPQALYAMNWTEAEVAWALSLNAIGDLITRALFILLSNLLLNVGSHKIYIFGLVLALFTRLGMLWSENKAIMITFITLMGIPRCIIMTLLQVVIADAVDQTKFTSAMGIVMFLFGFFNMVFGPIIGAIRDMTGSYSIAYYILSSCFGIIGILWSIEIVCKKNKQKTVAKEKSMKV